jgi:hypothetical protein
MYEPLHLALLALAMAENFPQSDLQSGFIPCLNTESSRTGSIASDSEDHSHFLHDKPSFDRPFSPLAVPQTNNNMLRKRPPEPIMTSQYKILSPRPGFLSGDSVAYETRLDLSMMRQEKTGSCLTLSPLRLHKFPIRSKRYHSEVLTFGPPEPKLELSWSQLFDRDLHLESLRREASLVRARLAEPTDTPGLCAN